jgi:hypothetical protein
VGRCAHADAHLCTVDPGNLIADPVTLFSSAASSNLAVYFYVKDVLYRPRAFPPNDNSLCPRSLDPGTTNHPTPSCTAESRAISPEPTR